MRQIVQCSAGRRPCPGHTFIQDWRDFTRLARKHRFGPERENYSRKLHVSIADGANVSRSANVSKYGHENLYHSGRVVNGVIVEMHGRQWSAIGNGIHGNRHFSWVWQLLSRQSNIGRAFNDCVTLTRVHHQLLSISVY